MIKAILFDLDGTLIDTNDLILKSFRHVFDTHLGHLTIEDEEIVKTFGEPLMGVMERYDKDRAKFLYDTYIKYNEAIHDELTKEIKGVKEGLTSLKNKGFKLAIVTSKRRAIALRGLKLFNLDRFMDVVITPEDTVKHKPEGEPVLKACEMLDVSPEEALMVGDSHNDILCGKNAGSLTCLVKYTALSVDEILVHKPNYVVDSIEEIVELVNI